MCGVLAMSDPERIAARIAYGALIVFVVLGCIAGVFILVRL